ncbi:MAG: hypothetical protein LBS96_04165 [Oscillospiraceae bacterium]|nr:hypothetical protein [Oscillospiraceae bacterium]
MNTTLTGAAKKAYDDLLRLAYGKDKDGNGGYEYGTKAQKLIEQLTSDVDSAKKAFFSGKEMSDENFEGADGNPESYWVFVTQLIAPLWEFVEDLDPGQAIQSAAKKDAEATEAEEAELNKIAAELDKNATDIGEKNIKAIITILEEYFGSEHFLTYRRLHWYYDPKTKQASDEEKNFLAQDRRFRIRNIENLVRPAIRKILRDYGQYSQVCASNPDQPKEYDFWITKQPCRRSVTNGTGKNQCPFKIDGLIDTSGERQDVCVHQMFRYWTVRRISRFLENLQSVKNNLVSKSDSVKATEKSNDMLFRSKMGQEVEEKVVAELNTRLPESVSEAIKKAKIPMKVKAAVRDEGIPTQIENAVTEKTNKITDNFYSNFMTIMSIFVAIVIVILLPLEILVNVAGKLVEPLANGNLSKLFLVSMLSLIGLIVFQLVAYMFYTIRNLLWHRKNSGSTKSPSTDKDKEEDKAPSWERRAYIIITILLLLGFIVFGAFDLRLKVTNKNYDSYYARTSEHSTTVPQDPAPPVETTAVQ